MDERRARKLFEMAREYTEEGSPDYLEWLRGLSPKTFELMGSKEFLKEYCSTVYDTGMKVEILEAKKPAIFRAFCGCDLNKLRKMTSVDRVLKVWNNKIKAESFLRGAHKIASEGFPRFKRRVQADWLPTLRELPGIGKINVTMLARNIGIADTAKYDIWLQRAVEALRAKDEMDLCGYLAESFQEKVGCVDFILWYFASDEDWKEDDSVTFQEFIRRL